MGTWIEIVFLKYETKSVMVVPFVGTWIEIINWYPIIDKSLSYPSWVRGLKSTSCISHPINLGSRTLRGYVD